jgi:hypothetical protein
MTDYELTSTTDGASKVPPQFAISLSGWTRWMGTAKAFVITLVVAWLMIALVLQVGAGRKGGRRARARIATLIALPVAGLVAMRRYRGQMHTLRCTEDTIELVSDRHTTRIEASRVQGLVGAGGVSFEGEVVIWKKILLVVDGELHAVAFDRETNALCYSMLRKVCSHAWGLPFGGELEPPPAGPELHPDDYATALEHIRRYFLSFTRKCFSTGALMVLGSGVALSVVASKVLQGEDLPRLAYRAAVWLGVLLIMGLVLSIWSLRQFPILTKIRNIEDRLRGAI